MRAFHLRLPAHGLLLALAVAAPPCFAQEGARQAGLPELDQVGRTLAGHRCAQPRKLERKPILNRHIPNVVDEVKTYGCDGFDAVVYQANASDPVKELPLQVRMHGAHPALGSELSVGATEAAIRGRLGTPARQEEGALLYALDETGDNLLTFHLAGGVVRAITWTWEVD